MNYKVKSILLMRSEKMVQIFVSHTKKDKKFCDDFDRVCAREEVGAYRSEYEPIISPAWQSIKNAMDSSVAMFVLIGKELVESQESGDSDWRYTQNWIAYEIGLACQKGIDVWAVCDEVLINFPMPYINNYSNVSLERRDAFDYMRAILREGYKKGNSFPFPYPYKPFGVRCGHCGIGFNLHVTIPPGKNIKCPQCLSDLDFPDGFNIPTVL